MSSIFTKKAHESTKGRGETEAARQQRRMDDMARAASQQFGKASYQGSTSADRARQDRDYGIADTDRRVAASGQRNQLASQEDARRAGVSDAIAGALDAQTQAEVKLKQEQSNQDRTTELTDRTNQWQTNEQMRQMDFKEFTNRTQRSDAIAELYREGRAEDALFDAALEGKLKMQDIDIYYKKLNSDLNNAFKLWEAGRKAEFEQIMADMQTRAINWGTAINGIVGVLGTIFTR